MEISVKIDDLSRLSYASDEAVGLDIRVPETISIEPLGRVNVDFKFSVELPPGTVGLLKVRPSWADLLMVNAGIIEPGDTGSVRAVIQSIVNKSIIISDNNAIVQLLVQPAIRIKPVGAVHQSKRQKTYVFCSPREFIFVFASLEF